MSAIFGATSIFALFLKMNNITLFIFKLIISIGMILIAFPSKNIRYFIKNILYLYLVSIVLGGALYFINIQFSYKQEGIIFYHNKMSINIIILLMISPFILYNYIKEMKKYKLKYNELYELEVILKNNQKLNLTAFLDTGNRLTDPYLNRPIIIINDIDIKYDDMILVPFNTILNTSYLKCFEVEKVKIKGYLEIKKVLLGISPKEIKMEGVDCIIGSNILEG
jgi:stage II sporulation protein GA (sporulation sigma-E factor processing peptidase)